MKKLLFSIPFFILLISTIYAQETGYAHNIEEAIRNCVNCNFCPDGKKIDSGKICVYFFWGQGCPHCNEEKLFLEELKNKYPLEIHDFEVYYNKENAEFWREVCKNYNVQPLGVPMTFIGKKVFIGFARKEVEKFEIRYEQIILLLIAIFSAFFLTFVLNKLKKVKR